MVFRIRKFCDINGFSLNFSVSIFPFLLLLPFYFFLYCFFGSPIKFFYHLTQNLYISKPNPHRRFSDTSRIILFFFFFGHLSYFTPFPFILLNPHCMKFWRDTESITNMEPIEEGIFMSLFSVNQETIIWF